MKVISLILHSLKMIVYRWNSWSMCFLWLDFFACRNFGKYAKHLSCAAYATSESKSFFTHQEKQHYSDAHSVPCALGVTSSISHSQDYTDLHESLVLEKFCK